MMRAVSDEPVRVVVGSTETDGIVICVSGGWFPDATDFWEATWLRTSVKATGGWFSASFTKGSDALQEIEVRAAAPGVVVTADPFEVHQRTLAGLTTWHQMVHCVLGIRAAN